MRHSVLIPFFNEEGVASSLILRIRAQLMSLGGDFEIIAVDDGSSDGTFLSLKALTECPELVILRFLENQGQAAALFEAMQLAKGDILITLDGDGQNPPEEIPKLLARLDDTVDMVVGVRARRNDSALRRRISRFANGVRSRFLHDGVRDSGCALKAFRREVVTAMIPIRTLYSFIPALAVAAGFRVEEQEVDHHSRETGVSNYNLRVFLWRPLVDMLGLRWFIARRCQGRIAREIHHPLP